MADNTNEYEDLKDSFTIGTPATTGAFKIYLDFKNTPEEKLIEQINLVLKLYKNLRERLGK